MKDEDKAKEQLINELAQLRQRIAEFEVLETERKQAEEALRESGERFRKLFEQSNDAIIIHQSGQIIDVNQRTYEMLGYSKDQLLTMTLQDLHPAQNHAESRRGVDAAQKGESLVFETQFKKDDGTIVDVEVSSGVIDREKGIIQGIVRNITERKRQEQQLAHMATHDLLTNLPNRILFNDRLSLSLAHAKRNRKKLAVMLLDLDRFKDINDTLGHSVGDKLLQTVANRLKHLLRKNDTVSRMGGDEFMLLLPEIAQVKHAAKIAQKVLGAVRRPLLLNGYKLHITPSIGIAIYPNDGEDADTLMRNSDIAMHRAKERGRDNWQRYTQPPNAEALE